MSKPEPSNAERVAEVLKKEIGDLPNFEIIVVSAPSPKEAG